MYSRELDVATKAIRDASKEYIFKKSEVKIKDNDAGAYDVVSENDVLIENFIKKRISEAFPDDSFLCEESGEELRSDRVWVIDPIDGTVNYTHMFLCTVKPSFKGGATLWLSTPLQ